MTDTARASVIAHQAARALECAALGNPRRIRIAPAADGGDVTLTSHEANHLTGSLRSMDVDASRPLGILTAHTSADGARIPHGKAWALVRAINDVDRAARRAHAISRGQIPGALNAREALQVARMMGH